MILNQEVKACPVCGGQPEAKLSSNPFLAFRGGTGSSLLECPKCHVKTKDYREVSRAVEDWNNNRFLNLEMRRI